MTDPRTEPGAERETETTPSNRRLTVDGLKTYLACPRRFQFEHGQVLRTDEETPQADRLDLLRGAICGALRAGDVDTLADRILERFRTRWEDYGEGFHSRTQRDHERRVLEAAIRAYVEAVGRDHADALYTTRSTGVDGELVGPRLPLTVPISIGRSDDGTNRSSADSPPESDSSTITLRSSVDYVFFEGSTVVGVSFVATSRHLGLLRYADEWEGDVEAAFTDHVDDGDGFEPRLVATLCETAAVLEGLRRLRDRLELDEGRTCRYLQVPLLDRDQLSINHLQGDVQTSLEAIDLTDPYLDHQTFGMTLEHRNDRVDGYLRSVAMGATSGPYEPGSGDRWDAISRSVCPRCPYAVCCPEYVSEEVAFDG